MSQDLRTMGTSAEFFSGVRRGWPWENDMLSLLSKASALFERTARLATAHQTGKATCMYIPYGCLTYMTENNDAIASYTEFTTLDQSVDELEAQLAPLTAGPTQKLLLAQTLVLASRIQLHSTFSEQSPVSRAKCVSAGRAIWEISVAANVETFVYLDSVIGVCNQGFNMGSKSS